MRNAEECVSCCGKKGLDLIQMYRVYHLSFVLARQLSRDVPADGRFLYDKAICL
jgi:hypothetical protein